MPYENTVCEVCWRGDRENQLLLCDRCDCGFHTKCIGKTKIPVGNWYCPRCRRDSKRPPPTSPSEIPTSTQIETLLDKLEFEDAEKIVQDVHELYCGEQVKQPISVSVNDLKEALAGMVVECKVERGPVISTTTTRYHWSTWFMITLSIIVGVCASQFITEHRAEFYEAAAIGCHTIMEMDWRTPFQLPANLNETFEWLPSRGTAIH